MFGSSRRPKTKAGALSGFIDEGSEIEGRYRFSGTVMVNGRFSGEIVDQYEKKNGALEFVVQRNWIADAWGGAVAEFDHACYCGGATAG